MTNKETRCLLALAMANWPLIQDKSFNVETTAALWCKILGHLPYADAEAGLAKVLLTARYFPTVAEVLEAANSVKPRPDGAPPAEEAWDEVCRNLNPYAIPEWSHEAIRVTVRRLGGIRNLCESENHAADRAHFFKLYDLHLNRENERILNSQVAALVSRSEMKMIT